MDHPNLGGAGGNVVQHRAWWWPPQRVCRFLEIGYPPNPRLVLFVCISVLVAVLSVIWAPAVSVPLGSAKDQSSPRPPTISNDVSEVAPANHHVTEDHDTSCEVDTLSTTCASITPVSQTTVHTTPMASGSGNVLCVVYDQLQRLSKSEDDLFLFRGGLFGYLGLRYSRDGDDLPALHDIDNALKQKMSTDDDLRLLHVIIDQYFHDKHAGPKVYFKTFLDGVEEGEEERGRFREICGNEQ